MRKRSKRKLVTGGILGDLPPSRRTKEEFVSELPPWQVLSWTRAGPALAVQSSIKRSRGAPRKDLPEIVRLNDGRELGCAGAICSTRRSS